MESLIGRLLAFYVFPMLGIVLVHEGHLSAGMMLYSELLVFPVYIGITKLLKLDFTDLKVGFQRQYFNRFLLPMNLPLVYLLSVVGLVVFEGCYSSCRCFTGTVKWAFIWFCFVMLLYFNAVSKERLETRDSRAKDRQLQELATYSQHVEMLYGRFVPFVMITWIF